MPNHSDRMPPYSEEAERGVLGSALTDTIRVLELLHHKGITDDHFYVPAHQKILLALYRMEKVKGVERIDLSTFGQFLKDSGELDEVGGNHFLEKLIDSTPTSAHAQYYIEILDEKYLLRKDIELGRKIIDSAYEGADPKKILTATIHRACELSIRKHDAPTILEMRERSLRRVANAKAGSTYGHETFMMPLNKVLIGWIPTNLYIAAAETSCGKSTFMFNDALFQAVEKQKPVAINSQEMRAELLLEQMAGCLAGVSFHKMRTGDYTDEDFEAIELAYDRIEKSPLFIEDSPMTFDELHTWSVMQVKRHGVKIIYGDYLQKYRTDPRDRRTRNEIIGDGTSCIKDFAKELEIPVVVLSQFSRSAHKQISTMPPPPTLNMLRDSGNIEQDADAVIFLYKKPGLDISQFGDCMDWPMEISVAKHRMGPTGTKNAYLSGHLQRWDTVYGYEERMRLKKEG